jgi:hypothetical protein
MLKLASLAAVLALLLQSMLGMLPLSHIPHEHILIGNVTAEELRAHEAAEATEAEGLSNPSTLPSSSNVVSTPHGGLIVSLAPPSLGVLSVLHFELALLAALIVLVPLFCFALPNHRFPWQALLLSTPDPPPRSFLASA